MRVKAEGFVEAMSAASWFRRTVGHVPANSSPLQRYIIVTKAKKCDKRKVDRN